jgi:hypothetical protein
MQRLSLLSLIVGLASAPVIGAPACEFNAATLAFVGSPGQQAECLLRPIGRYAVIGNAQPLPELLNALIGTVPTISKWQLRAYLNAHGISEASVGGSLDAQVSHSHEGRPGKTLARYFVIHDTSTPNLASAEFPAHLDDSSWSGNQLSTWVVPKPVAHVFINRMGESISPLPFAQPWRATQFEMRYGSLDVKGLMLHVELIQPRQADPKGPRKNDAIAPSPGFTKRQYDRLALVYTAASLRRGEWMTPAFHAVLDAAVPGAHDDPQNFSLIQFADALGALLNALQGHVPR